MKKYFVFCLLFAIFLVSCGKKSVNYDRTPEATLNVGSVSGTDSNGAPLPSEPEKELSIQVGGTLEVQNVKVSDHKKNVTITFGDGKGGTKEVTAKINPSYNNVASDSGVVIGELVNGDNVRPLTVYVSLYSTGGNDVLLFSILVGELSGNDILKSRNAISEECSGSAGKKVYNKVQVLANANKIDNSRKGGFGSATIYFSSNTPDNVQFHNIQKVS